MIQKYIHWVSNEYWNRKHSFHHFEFLNIFLYVNWKKTLHVRPVRNKILITFFYSLFVSEYENENESDSFRKWIWVPVQLQYNYPSITKTLITRRSYVRSFWRSMRKNKIRWEVSFTFFSLFHETAGTYKYKGQLFCVHSLNRYCTGTVPIFLKKITELSTYVGCFVWCGKMRKVWYLNRHFCIFVPYRTHKNKTKKHADIGTGTVRYRYEKHKIKPSYSRLQRLYFVQSLQKTLVAYKNT